MARPRSALVGRAGTSVKWRFAQPPRSKACSTPPDLPGALAEPYSHFQQTTRVRSMVRNTDRVVWRGAIMTFGRTINLQQTQGRRFRWWGLVLVCDIPTSASLCNAESNFLCCFAIVRSGRLHQRTRPVCCTRMPQARRCMPKLASSKIVRARYERKTGKKGRCAVRTTKAAHEFEFRCEFDFG